jgi:hypothetical protein
MKKNAKAPFFSFFLLLRNSKSTLGNYIIYDSNVTLLHSHSIYLPISGVQKTRNFQQLQSCRAVAEATALKAQGCLHPTTARHNCVHETENSM